MKLTPQLADKIAKRYDRNHNGFNDFRDELFAMIKTYGLEILDAEAQRELIVNLGRQRRFRERANIKRRAHIAALQAATSTMAAE